MATPNLKSIVSAGKLIFGLFIALHLAACASIPEGPTVAVMPAPGEPFGKFATDDITCRDFAKRQLGVKPRQATSEQVMSGAVVGTAAGAAAGALMGGGHGRAIGSMAGAGLLAGTAIGAGAASETGWTLQRRYNVAYMQCMYAKGNQVPGYPQPRRAVPPPPPPGQSPPAAH
jgi:hypothetical protein